jgi:hypothetical protein
LTPCATVATPWSPDQDRLRATCFGGLLSASAVQQLGYSVEFAYVFFDRAEEKDATLLPSQDNRVFSLHCSGIVAFESNIDATRHQLLLVKLYLQFQSCCFLLASCSIAACNTFAAEFLPRIRQICQFCHQVLFTAAGQLCLHIAVFLCWFQLLVNCCCRSQSPLLVNFLVRTIYRKHHNAH